MISVTAYACPPYWTPISIRPTPPPVVKPPSPPPQPVHTGSYSDFLSCEAAALSFMLGSKTGRVAAVVSIVGVKALLSGGSWLYPLAGYAFDLAITLEIRETCINQVYGPGYF